MVKSLVSLLTAGILVSGCNNDQPKIDILYHDMNGDGVIDVEVYDPTNGRNYAFISQKDSSFVRAEYKNDSTYPFWLAPNGDIYGYTFVPGAGEAERALADSTYSVRGKYILEKIS